MPAKRRKANSEHTDLAQKAYQGIRQMLFYNEIIPGQKIKYQDLADKIGVSITPVIHALKWLEFKNIVKHEPNRGYFVNEVSFQEIKEIYDSRLLLEVSLVPDILRNVDTEALKQLRKASDAYRTAVDEDNFYSRLMADMQFHLNMAAISRCRIQLKMLQELFDILLLKYARNLVLLGITESSLSEHNEIFHHLETGNESGLRQSLSTHLEHVRTHITQGFKKIFVQRKEPVIDLDTFR